MGILRNGAQLMNPFIFLIKIVTRSIIYHPFFVGFFILLFFLNKSFPFLFSLFLNASPILVSTAILLGTLLSFGQLNLPEIEKENRSNSGFVSLKTEISIDGPSVSERYGVQRHISGKNKEVVEKGDGNPLDFEPLIDEESREVKSQKPDSEFEVKRDRNWVVLEDYCSKIGKENTDADTKNYRPLVEPTETGEKIESSQENSVRDESSDDESDGDESVSQNPPTSGVIPLIDELDPLLDENAHEPVQKSQESSNYGTDESDDDDTSEEEEFGDAGNEGDDDDDEREKSGKEVIRWSEDDRKNVANLGTIELERNERLESVIARRRWQRLMAEKNLIDLDSTDFPTNNDNTTPISAARHNNPFDIPPIPTRSNPFDLPEERSEPLIDISNQGSSSFPPKEMSFRRHESFNTGLTFSGESLIDDLSSFPPREVFFRRHESFNMGPSIFGLKLKPYFVTERAGFEGTSYSSLERHSSEISESMASSVPESDYVSSDEDKDQDKDQDVDVDFSHEPKLISDLDYVSEQIEHGSESSEDDEDDEKGDDNDHDEVEIKFGDVESNAETVSDYDEVASSSSSGVQVEIPDEEEDDDLASEISVANSVTELPKEPVYDSSPRGIHKDLSFSSVTSEVQVEFSETGEPPVLVKRTVSFDNKESNVRMENGDIDTLVNKANGRNESDVTDSVDKVVVLQINPDQNQSIVEEKLQVATEHKVNEDLSYKTTDGPSSKVHEDFQEEQSTIKKDAVTEATVSHDHEQENIKEQRKSENDGEIKSNSNLNFEKESNSTENVADVTSVSLSDPGKDKKKKKNKKSSKGSSSSSTSSSSSSSSSSDSE